MHVLAAAGGDGELGRPDRTEASGDPLGLGEPPGLNAVNARLDTLSDVLTGPTRAPALVRYAVVHGELLVLRPFATANGLVARAAARLVLVERGLDPKSVSVPEVGHVELRQDYAEAARGYATGSTDGLGRWITHCGRAVELGVREGLAVCEALLRGA